MKLDSRNVGGSVALAALLALGTASYAAAEEEPAVAAETAPAEEESDDWFPGAFSANVNWATDYVFRGVSQTNEHGALQGGIDWAWEMLPKELPGMKLMVGSWGSNVDFSDGDQGQLEIDIYGGVTGSVGSLSYGALAIYYEYPGAKPEYDYWEFGPNLAYDFGFMALSGQYLYSPDFFLGSDDAHWFTAGLTVPTPGLPSWAKVVFGANIGQQLIEDESDFGARDYLTWDTGATVSAFGLDVDLRYFDTDLSRDGCFGGGRTFGDLCEPRFVVSVGKVF